MLTAFGQTAFGQFWCFNSLAKFSVVVDPGCRCLVPVGGACWWLLFVCVCSRFLGLSPRTPLRRKALPLDHPKFRSFFSLSAGNFFHSSLSGGLLVAFCWCFCEDRDPQMCTFGLLNYSSHRALQNSAFEFLLLKINHLHFFDPQLCFRRKIVNMYIPRS